MAREGKAKVLSLQEFKRVSALILSKRHSKRNLAMLCFSFDLGLRACEIRRLTIGDVLELDGTIKERINLTKTKGKKAREIYLTNKKLREILKNHLDEMKIMCEKKRISFSDNRPLFMSQKGNFFHPAQFIMLFQKFFKDAGISGAKSHSGRRTFITNKINEGINIKSISTMVGHTNISMTVKYHDENPDQLKKIFEKGAF